MPPEPSPRAASSVRSFLRDPSLALPALATVWAFVCVSCFLANRPIPFGTDRFPPFPTQGLLTPYFFERVAGMLLRVGIFWMAAWRCGRWLQRKRGTDRPGLERGLVECGLGAGALGLASFALGTVHMLDERLLRIVLFALSLAALPAIASSAQEIASSLRRGVRETMTLSNAVPSLFLSGAVLYQLLICLGPTLFYDALAYHLALPALYLRRGAFVPTPLNAYAGIPAGVEMLYAWLLPLGGQGSACQLLHLSLGLLAAATVFAIGRRMRDSSTGLWAAAFFLSSPMAMLASGRPGIELGWSFYLALTLLMLTSAGGDAPADRRALTLAAIFAGLALGTKYQAVLLLPAVGAYLVHRFGRRGGIRMSLKFWTIAVLCAAPWGIKNIAFYRNPVYPFFGGTIFPPSTAVDIPAFLSSAHGRDIGAVFHRWSALKEFLVHPWSYAMPREDSEADNVLSLVFVIALPFLPFAVETDARPLLTMSALLWLPMNLISGLARFSIPALVPLSLVVARTIDFSGRRARALRLAAAMVFSLSFLYVHSKTDALTWRLLSGEIPEKVFLSYRRPTYPAPPFAVYDWANSNLKAKAKVLLVGEPRSFYLDRDSETSSPYAVQPIALYANDSSSEEDLYRRLKAAGITHLYLNFAAMGFGHQSMRMSAQGLASLRGLWGRYLAPVYVDSDKDPNDFRFSVLYRLLNEDEARQPHSAPEFPFEGRTRSDAKAS